MYSGVVEEPARELRGPVDGHLAVEIVLADVRREDGRRLVAADARTERLVQVGAAVAEALAHGVQDAHGVGVVVEADLGAPGDRQLLAAAADRAQGEVGRDAVTQEALLHLGVVERVEAAAETQRRRRQLAEHGRRATGVPQLLLDAAPSQRLATTNRAAAAAAAADARTSIISQTGFRLYREMFLFLVAQMNLNSRKIKCSKRPSLAQTEAHSHRGYSLIR